MRWLLWAALDADDVLRRETFQTKAASFAFFTSSVQLQQCFPGKRRLWRDVGTLERCWFTTQTRHTRPLGGHREAFLNFLCYFILSGESGLASFVARVWNPADSPLLAPSEIEFWRFSPLYRAPFTRAGVGEYLLRGFP